MNRRAIHRNIKFEGLIQGCADYQWLLTDALYETAPSAPGPSPRWRIKSQTQKAAKTPRQTLYHFQDHHLNLHLSASSAAELAEQIRVRFHNPTTQS